MLEKIISASLRNKLLVLLALILLATLGIYSLFTTPIDALPDLSDVQVIVYSEYRGQSPRVVEDQVTYPLTTALVSVPGARAVRGYSFFGYSLVYVLFEDGTDIYWARSRVLEYLNYAQKRLPVGVAPTLGPDATGVGWVFEYALTSNKRSLQELRSYQDFYLKYGLSTVQGVSEVASVGGYTKQYQVTVDPARLQALGIPLSMVEMALQNGNGDAGGEVIELGEMEFMIRGRGYIRSLEDILNIPVSVNASRGVPIRISDIGDVSVGPEMRRGIAELDGKGEVAGGIVVMRYGANAREVIRGVREKLKALKAGLPEDVEIVTTYDRSGLIDRAVAHLNRKLIEEFIVVALVCFLFLLHLRSALVVVFTLPIAVLVAFIVMKQLGISANIMSLGGIAVAVGAMVDAAVIMIENAHKHLEQNDRLPQPERRSREVLILESAREVGPTLFWSLLVITLSFIPVFTLGDQEGRLFKPLAYTKTFSMAAAALLSVTLVPVLMFFFIRGKIRSEHTNPVNRFLDAVYHPLAEFSLRHPRAMVGGAVALVLLSIIPFLRLGSEFMPPLYEGDLLYMPTTLPGISVTKAKELLQKTDQIIRSFPEVDRVFGKVGRAETATDPAGLDMIETVILLKDEKKWRPGMTPQKLIDSLDAAVRFPGLTNSWTMPIKTRIDMLSTGIKTPVGVKISGPNLDTLERIGRDVEAALRATPGTRSAFAERTVGGNYLNVDICRVEAARFGLNVSDLKSVIETALGGMTVTTTVEGLERYSVNLRYSRELRDNPDAIKRVLITAPDGSQIPLGQVAAISIEKGPMVIRSEGTRPNSWVFVDVENSDIGAYVKNAQSVVGHHVRIPVGYDIAWSGEYEYMERAKKRLWIAVPLTLLILFIILFLNTRSIAKTLVVLLAVPFSLVGAFFLLYLLGYHLSVAVWIGLIALAGLDAETGVVMLLYLDHSLDKFKKTGPLTLLRLKEAILDGAVKRVRPKIMTASVILAGLLPILFSHGTGADVMKRIAAPMVGGVITSVAMELLVYPAVYFLLKKKETV